jgi:hypothetical protein
MKNKKGAEFAIGTVVMVVLGLAVLIILILVVRQQVTKGAQGYTGIANQTDLSPTKCTNLILGRSCTTAQQCASAGGRYYSSSPQGAWQDCGAGQGCCETS